MNEVPVPLDEHFVRLMLELHGREDALFAEAVRTVSARRREGHVCVPPEELRVSAKVLQSSPAVGAPGDFKPLILDAAGRLYLQRYWQYEDNLARALRQRLEQPARFDAALLETGLRTLCALADEDQRDAARAAVQNRFCVITGGPGTGKTHTIAMVLALLEAQAAAVGEKLRVKLAAPTGKAAARMKDALASALEQQPALAPLREKLSAEAATIHRLLGTIPDSPFFRHDATRPLLADVVVIDEASMVDLALMAKLVAAVPETARLILLGDKDQLASVEAGKVLGDICAASGSSHIVELRQNHRFGSTSALQQLSQRVNAGDANGTLELLRAAPPDMQPVAAPRQSVFAFDERASPHPIRASRLPSPAGLENALRERAVEGFRAFLTAADPASALAHLNDFRVLCALRVGPFGVAHVNGLIEKVLADAGLIDPSATAYPRRPIVVLENDYSLELFNGDTGVLLPDPKAAGEVRAFFPGEDGILRSLLPARLPAHETVYAMTVHKSQGSEFARVLFILPDRESPVLTRELLYTGLTRARETVELWHEEAVLRSAILRRVERTSGLRDALSGVPA